MVVTISDGVFVSLLVNVPLHYNGGTKGCCRFFGVPLRVRDGRDAHGGSGGCGAGDHGTRDVVSGGSFMITTLPMAVVAA